MTVRSSLLAGDERIDALEADNTTTAASVADLQTRVTDLETQVADLEARVAALEGTPAGAKSTKK